MRAEKRRKIKNFKARLLLTGFMVELGDVSQAIF